MDLSIFVWGDKNENIDYVYPNEFDKLLTKNDKKDLKKFYFGEYSMKMENIRPQKVIDRLDILLKEIGINNNENI